MLDVIPEPRVWEPTRGTFRLSPRTRIVTDPALAGLGDLLAEEASSGDIVLRLGPVDRGYVLELGESATVTAASPEEVMYGTRTLLQLLRQKDEIPAGVIRDWPRYAERGILIDTVPRSYSREWWTWLVRELALLKYNELTVLLSGVGLGDDEAAWLDALCRRYHVNLTPSLGMPSHCDDLLARHPSYALVPGATHPLLKGAFDFTRPGALAVLQEEVERRIGTFSGAYWHAGGDEYLAYPGNHREWSAYPQLAAFARERTGDPAATGSDAFTWLLNWLHALVKRHGKTLRVWNDHLEAGTVTLDPEIVVEHWYQPAAPQALTPRQLAATNPLVNCHEELTYYDMGWRHLDPKRITEEFRVTHFQGGETVPEGNLLGARLQVWMPEGGRAANRFETNEELAENLTEPLRAFASAVW
ncbi:beta-N-acetylhexosaminidase [Nonomuraea sediminis]|uniref:beta-N-acetylhexosaminidase n=1 Tax=Nonomuraea sediminis TaxID=2835864 RepID=UPI001BDBFB96|nr:beta-N-acetylhexosaminidase [Nonomuraea sediminis]